MSKLPNSALNWNTGGPQTYSEADINGAVEAGILPAEEASALKQHLAEPDPQVNEEAYRMGGFNDTFVYTACLALLLPIYGYSIYNPHGGGALSLLIPLGMCLVIWGLTEYFVRIKHLPLTARVLTYAFGSLYFGTVVFQAYMLLDLDSPSSQSSLIIIINLASIIIMWFHWKRFQIPISWGLMALSIAFFIMMTLRYFFPILEYYKATPYLISGALLLVYAIYVDSSDPGRRTKRADIAFWLYIASAYCLLQPILFSLETGSPYSSNPIPEAIDITVFITVIIAILYGVVAFISLCLDRQVAMVSSVSYMLYALTVLFSGAPDLRQVPSQVSYYFGRGSGYRSVTESAAISGIIVGVTLFVLVIFWARGRVGVLSILPKSIQRKLPPAPNPYKPSSSPGENNTQEPGNSPGENS